MARRYRTGTISASEFARLVAEAERIFRVPAGVIQSRTKRWRYSAARGAVVLVVCDALDVPFTRVGTLLGRDSSSVFYACAAAEERRFNDPLYRRKVKALLRAVSFVPERLAA